MNQNLKDMLQSEDEEDVELAFIIARRSKVSPLEVAKLFGIDNINNNEIPGYNKHWYIFYYYIRSTHMGRKWKWRKEL